MTPTIPLVLLLGGVVVLLHRSDDPKVCHSAIIALFGFANGNSSASRPINAASQSVLHGFGIH